MDTNTDIITLDGLTVKQRERIDKMHTEDRLAVWADAIEDGSLEQRTIIERFMDTGSAYKGVTAHRKDLDKSKGAKAAGRMVYRRTTIALCDAKGRIYDVLDRKVEVASYMTTNGTVVGQYADKLNPITMFTRGIRLPGHREEVIRCPDFAMMAYWAEQLLRVPCNLCNGTGRDNATGKKCARTMPLRTAWTADKIAYAIGLFNKRNLANLDDAYEWVTFTDGDKNVSHGLVKPPMRLHVLLDGTTDPKTVPCDTCNGKGIMDSTSTQYKWGCMECNTRGTVKRRFLHNTVDTVAMWSAIPKQPIIREGDVVVGDFETFAMLLTAMENLEVRRGKNIVRPFYGMKAAFDVVLRDAMLVPSALMGQPRAVMGNVPREVRTQVAMKMALEYTHNLRALDAAISMGCFLERDEPTGAITYEKHDPKMLMNQ